MEVVQPEAETLFIAVVLYVSSSSTPSYKPMYEESFVLFRAETVEQAREKAEAHALRSEASYENEYGEQIRWLRKHLIDVAPVLYEDLEDGTEIYARHFHDYAAYRAFEPLLGPSPGSPHSQAG
ncbi:MAG: DUF4288 domain-containing protein [Acidimicrobiales bacterium]